MLTYLDSLCDALCARDAARLQNLVEGHPLARLLPADVMAEVQRFLSARVSRHAVPLLMLRFRDQTALLLREAPRTETMLATARAPERQSHERPPRPRRRRNSMQTELPLLA